MLYANVLHHSLDPIHALRRLMKVARRKVVLEIATPTLRDVRTGVITPATYLARFAPIVAVGRPTKSAKMPNRTFLPSPRAIAAMFNDHGEAFEPVRILRSPFKDGRFIIVARKRRIKRLTVVAGPPAVGKRTFIERMKDPGFATRFGLSGTSFSTIDVENLHRLEAVPHEHLILNYNMLWPWGDRIRSHRRDPALDLLSTADEVNIVTLVCPQQQLVSRLAATRPAEPSHAHSRLLELYQAGTFLPHWYKSWIDYCDAAAPRSHIALQTTDDYVSVDLHSLGA